MTTALIIAALGSKAFWLLYVWLASAWGASALSNRKGYGEKVGLGSGLLLSVIGLVIWVIIPAKSTSIASQRKAREEESQTPQA
jgi:hypothetical protein